MALTASLSRTARFLADAVALAARNQNLKPDEYELTGTYYDRSDHIGLQFVTTSPIDERKLYHDTFATIRDAFPDNPQCVLHVGLVIRTVDTADQLFRDSNSGPDNRDITDLLRPSR